MKLKHFVLVLFGVLPLNAQSKRLSPEAIYSKSRASVVTVLTFDTKKAPIGQGSGFVVARNRIVTNYHVVAGSSFGSVIFNDGSIAAIQDVIAASRPKDLAVLEVETGNRPGLPLGDELHLNVGETVYAIGAPQGLSASLSNGLVSGFRQQEGQFQIQITAPIAPGSSGGPLLNSSGEVVGVTTSRLVESGFGFAMGAGDIQHLIKAPLTVKLELSDLPGDEAGPPGDALSAVQSLYDSKKYDDAENAFSNLSDTMRKSYDGQLLLCRIEEQKDHYSAAVTACDAAIRLKPDDVTPYRLKGAAQFLAGATDEAEQTLTRALSVAPDANAQALLAAVHYIQEKYNLVPQELTADTDRTFDLTLLAGAALHNKNYEQFRALRQKLATLKSGGDAWTLFSEAYAAYSDLNWSQAIAKYKQCDADSDLIDSICAVSLAETQMRSGKYDDAKAQIDETLRRFPRSSFAKSMAIFINLQRGNFVEADRLHDSLLQTGAAVDHSGECLYYYGRNLPYSAMPHCNMAIQENGSTYTAWSNAAYVALDNGDFETAGIDIRKAADLFYASKDKHTVSEEVDITWAVILADYYSGETRKQNRSSGSLKRATPFSLRRRL